MDTSYRKIFHGITVRKPNPKLHEKIMLRIDKMQKHRARTRFWSLVPVSLVSFVVLILAFRYLLTSFAESGAYQYISLAFSGNGIFLLYWKEITLSVVESMPLFAVILVFSVLLVFISSLVSTIRNAQKISFQFN